MIEETNVIPLNKKGQPRKRKPKEPRIYFTEDTEKYIIHYISLEDQKIRNQIYKEHIQYAFYKLSENIIHTFKFYHTDSDTIEELKHEVVTFLLEKLHLFNHSKNVNDKLTKIITKEYDEFYEKDSFKNYTNGAVTVTQEQINEFISKLNVSEKCFEQISQITPPKAYSYFGTIAKRYLITYNDNNYKKLQEYAELDEVNDESDLPYDEIENSGTNTDYGKFFNLYIKYIDKHLYTLFPKKQDHKVADAIMELFRKSDNLEIYNKKALYIYIREITDATTPQITKITKKLDDIRKKLYNQYYENDYIRI